jgi:hypothetical protein
MKKTKTSSEWAGDKKYIAKRNRLIPMAVRHADIVAGTNRESDEWAMAYHAEMRQLAHRELGCPI